MKPYLRLAEPKDLSALADIYRDSFASNQENNTETFTDFLNKLLQSLTRTLKAKELIPKNNEPATFHELYQLYKSESERDSKITTKAYSQHICTSLADAVILEILIQDGEFEEALVRTVLFTAQLLTKYELEPSSVEKVSWGNFDPLIGEYPELENMNPSSIGGQLEADAAKWIKENGTKPVVGFIAGETAPKGRKMGHAGAIIGGKDDTASAKKSIMRDCGISVVDSPAEIGSNVQRILN